MANKNIKSIKKTAKAKKAVVKKVTKKRVKVEAPKLKPIKETFSKTELLTHLEEETQLDKKVVKTVMTKLEETILRSMQPSGAGEFVLAGILKIFTKKVPARKAGVMVRNPATGELVKGKAKPASVRVKIRALSKIKKAAIG